MANLKICPHISELEEFYVFHPQSKLAIYKIEEQNAGS